MYLCMHVCRSIIMLHIPFLFYALAPQMHLHPMDKIIKINNHSASVIVWLVEHHLTIGKEKLEVFNPMQWGLTAVILHSMTSYHLIVVVIDVWL